MSTQTNMTEQSLPNGLPLQLGKPNIMQSTVPFNGIDSSHSSRTSSPANRLQQIPSSQLPPSRSSIPASQLPPSSMKPACSVNQVSQNYGNLSISQTTPLSSPKIELFGTSTPVINTQKQDSQTEEISPIHIQNVFKHSTQSHFTNVPNSNNTNGQPLLEPSKQESSNNVNTQNLMQNKSKMHQSLSQPTMEAPIHKNIQTPLPNQSQISKPPSNFGSTPNMHQIFQQQFNQNLFLNQNVPKTTAAPNAPSTIPFNTVPPNARVGTNQPNAKVPFQKMQYPMPVQQVQQNLISTSQPLPAIRPLVPPPTNNTQPLIPQPTNTAQSQPLTNISQPKTNLHSNRYPAAPQYQNNLPHQPPYQNVLAPKPSFQNNLPSQPQYQNNLPSQTQYQNNLPSQLQYQNFGSTQMQQQHQFQNLRSNSVVQSGFSKLWGQENLDLLQCPNILPPTKVEPPRINLGQDFLDAANCSSDIFRCTMTKIPETSSLLQKSRLPLGILIHPFKDLDHLHVIDCSIIVRCRACRTYINPFVFFVDMKRWKCNLCYRVNELPEEFQFDPETKTYGDPSRRPEIKSSTIEYIAPLEYTLRPPQAAVYMFLLDVSHVAVESGYIHNFCNVLTTTLGNLPGDARTQVGFIAYNSALHFYSLAEGLNQPHEMTVLDIDDVFLPCPDNLIVNLQERKELILDLLAQLPTRFNNSYDTGSALGGALQAAYKMIASVGGRITVFQASLPSIGPGALTVREDPNQRAGVEVHHLNPANDFYKRLALECSCQQIAVDLFIVNSQYVDLSTISGISRFSGGCIYHFPLFKATRVLQAENFDRSLKRYLTRKIGFEAVMRIRCTRGLSIHTFHGNFFVKSTDLLSLPNVNPDAGFGMQVSIDENLSDLHTVCFQAALLYTSSRGERRIRVHTLCIPVVSTLPDVLASADQQCIVGLLAKMAVDRSMQSSLADAREAFLNVAIDILSTYKMSLNLGSDGGGLQVSNCLKLLPLYISGILKHIAFRTGTSTRLDDRVKAMCDMKTLPLCFLIQQIYPDLYPVHNLLDQSTILNTDGDEIPQLSHLQLTARSLDSKGAFLMDMGEQMIMLIGPSVSEAFLNEGLGVPNYNSISDQMYNLPILDTLLNQRLNNFINHLNDEKPFPATLHIIRENSPHRSVFIERLIEDRIETALSYHEFLQHLKTQVK